MIRIVGIENVRPYVDGGNTGDVAVELEERFDVGKRFVEFIEKDLESKFMSNYETELKRSNYDFERALDKTLFLVSQWLTKEWREYILLAKHGMTTKASQKRGDPAFVDTGAYFQNMQIRLVR